LTERGEIRELGSESFENNQKISEYLYSAPILLWRFPLRVGLRFSYAKAVSGYDNAAGVEGISALETCVAEVVGKETLMMPAAIHTYRLRTWGTSTGTMTIGGTKGQIIITYEENLVLGDHQGGRQVNFRDDHRGCDTGGYLREEDARGENAHELRLKRAHAQLAGKCLSPWLPPHPLLLASSSRFPTIGS